MCPVGAKVELFDFVLEAIVGLVVDDGELNSTISRPFPRPAHGRTCVKVINHFGDEVQKVFQV